jgi:SAM-dependent methyltransferase
MLKNPKIAFMTSLGANVGDEFIREGICSFLDEVIESWEPFYVNKVDLSSLHEPREDETSLLKDKFRDADVIIQAGAPVYWRLGNSTCYNVEWAEELWQNHIFQLGSEKPILNIAAGSCQPYPDFAKTLLSDPMCAQFVKDVSSACVWTSVRDPLASQILHSLGLEHDVLPCTAFHAARRTNLKADYGEVIGINLMPLGGHYRLSDDIHEDIWRTKIEAFLPQIRKHHRVLFIAHDVSEKEFMRPFLGPGETLFFSPCWRDYLPVYAKCAATVANRVHGAVCAAGFGRPSVILGNDTRLLIGDYIGIPSHYIGAVSPEEIVDLLESGLKTRKSEKDRLLGLREESAARYRQAIVEGLETFLEMDRPQRSKKVRGQKSRKTLSLSSTKELSSGVFQDFMTTLNCFSQRLGLRQFTDWSKIWEYPWLWFNGLSTMDWLNTKVLDLGSELSPMPWFLAGLGAQVTLAETDPQWIPTWERLVKKTGLDVEWRILPDEHLPFPEGYFDLVTSFSVIEHQTDKLSAVAEVSRVLKPGGLFAISFDVCEPDMGMTFPEWNGKALTMKEFEELIWENSAFDNKGRPANWNVEDCSEFIKWHLQSAPHHNYVVGGAVLEKRV